MLLSYVELSKADILPRDAVFLGATVAGRILFYPSRIASLPRDDRYCYGLLPDDDELRETVQMVDLTVHANKRLVCAMMTARWPGMFADLLMHWD
jgi:hypothetical protein